MYLGYVSYFDETSGYGHLHSDSVDEDVFFHMNEVGNRDPKELELVEFYYEDTDEGPRATEMVLFEPSERIRTLVQEKQSETLDSHLTVHEYASITSELLTAVRSSALSSDESAVREQSITILEGLTHWTPEIVADSISTFAELLTAEDQQLRDGAISTLENIARHDTRLLVNQSVIENLVTVLYHNVAPHSLSHRALDVIEQVDRNHPASVRTAVEEQENLLSRGDFGQQVAAANRLSLLALRCKGRFESILPTLIERLTCWHQEVRLPVALVVAEIASENAEYLDNKREVLAELLEDQESRVRKAACMIYETIGITAEYEKKRLKSLTDSGDEEIREKSRTILEEYNVVEKNEQEENIDEQKRLTDQDVTASNTLDGRVLTVSGQIVSDSLPEPVSKIRNQFDYEDSIALRIASPSDSSLYREEVRWRIEQAEAWMSIHDHRYIAEVRETGMSPVPWLAIERGDFTLEERNLPLSPSESLYIGYAVANALSRAHSESVYHLNLKPSNILFNESVKKQWYTVKVTDFDCEPLFREDDAPYKDIDLRFAAPEQVDPKKYGVISPATDIYQLGLLIYYMLEGEPFKNPHPCGSVVLSEGIPNVPSKFPDSLRRILATDPERRPDDMESVRRKIWEECQELDGDYIASKLNDSTETGLAARENLNNENAPDESPSTTDT